VEGYTIDPRCHHVNPGESTQGLSRQHAQHIGVEAELPEEGDYRGLSRGMPLINEWNQIHPRTGTLGEESRVRWAGSNWAMLPGLC
jgi:hypothetical protein